MCVDSSRWKDVEMSISSDKHLSLYGEKRVFKSGVCACVRACERSSEWLKLLQQLQVTSLPLDYWLLFNHVHQILIKKILICPEMTILR